MGEAEMTEVTRWTNDGFLTYGRAHYCDAETVFSPKEQGVQNNGLAKVAEIMHHAPRPVGVE